MATLYHERRYYLNYLFSCLASAYAPWNLITTNYCRAPTDSMRNMVSGEQPVVDIDPNLASGA